MQPTADFFSTWIARDALFTAEVAREAAALGLNIIEVDGELNIVGVTKKVAERLGLATP